MTLLRKSRKTRAAFKAEHSVFPTPSPSVSESDSDSDTESNPCLTLPTGASEYIRLRFQLQGYNIHRVAHVPSKYSFANLHMLILYMFGWSRYDAYKAHVLSRSALADDWYEPGMDCAPCPAYHCDEWEREGEVMPTLWTRYAYDEIRRIAPQLTRVNSDFSRVPVMDDRESTLADIWAPEIVHNVSRGRHINSNIGIRYTCNRWTVFITCQMGDVFHYPPVVTSNNLPVVIVVQGVPPKTAQEESAYSASECPGECKPVSPRLFDPADFEAYCASVIEKCQLEIACVSRTYYEEDEWGFGARHGLQEEADGKDYDMDIDEEIWNLIAPDKEIRTQPSLLHSRL
ncbi:hypothetical protein PAXRUDRAFT_828789 [Paxillus rubicundulus Ve08.2h10]|uniref:Uncharacterized protein n=1 Tax=Paxillus rubicundulus Ve08.2h10 TaxID=930991 RepID=A0A0D0E0V4_9AGAM|nr:hypothetical protein PAXRUDRAFT_828789 [Paxillus rubicundulus Ve08.2h10]